MKHGLDRHIVTIFGEPDQGPTFVPQWLAKRQKHIAKALDAMKEGIPLASFLQIIHSFTQPAQ